MLKAVPFQVVYVLLKRMVVLYLCHMEIGLPLASCFNNKCILN
jgi:hypothetical protein